MTQKNSPDSHNSGTTFAFSDGDVWYTLEQIVAKLHQAVQLQAKGVSIDEVARQLNIRPDTYQSWQRDFGGLSLEQASRLLVLEADNQKLRDIVTRLRAENEILQKTSPPIVYADPDH